MTLTLAFAFVFFILPIVSPWEGLNDNLRVVGRFNQWALGKLESLFADYGYYVVFIGVLLENSMFLGLFVPGAIILILAGLSAENGAINIWYVLPLAIAATIIGDTISYCIGRLGLVRALERTSMGPALEKIRVRMESHTTWIILAYHFAGYSRLLGPAAAGLFRIPFRRWAPLDYLGGTAWVLVFTGVGVLLGLAGVEFSDTKRVTQIVEIVIFVGLVAAVLAVYARAGRGGGEPTPPGDRTPTKIVKVDEAE